MDDKEIEHRLTAVEQTVNENTRDIEELKPIVKEINTMSKTMVQLVEQSKTTNENVIDLKHKVNAIEKEPADQYKQLKKTIWTCVITTIIGAIIGALISLIIK